MKKILSVLLTLPLIWGCNPINQPVKNSLSKTTVENIESQKNGQIIAEVSDKSGASFSAKINFNNFATKANNISGTPAKQPVDVAMIDVYLLTLPQGYNGSDPLGTGNTNVTKIFSNLAKSGNNINILFKNVQGLEVNQYWAGIVAKDADGKVISKTNNLWTGQTATLTPSLSLSTGGVGVNPLTLEVTTTQELNINISLLDVVGAQIASDANINNGNPNLPTVTLNKN